MHALIVGDRGVGKTTLLNKIATSLALPYAGYVTRKEDTLYDEKKGVPVCIYEAGKVKVPTADAIAGYCKDERPAPIRSTFDAFADKLIANTEDDDWIIMDEIGTMETCSDSFCDAVLSLFDREKPILAAVKSKERPYLERIRKHPNCKCFVITKENRDCLYDEVLEFVKKQIEESKVQSVKVMRQGADGQATETSMTLAGETHVRLVIDGGRQFEFVASVGNLKELCVGWAVSEGLLSDVSQIAQFEIKRENTAYFAHMTLVSDTEKSDRKATFSTSDAPVDVKENPGVIFRMVKEAGDAQKMHQLTGGTHSCTLFCGTDFVKTFEDIGRHNAMDKAIGYLVLNELRPASCALYFTGRVMTETIEKLRHAGIFTLITKALPTSDAAKLARESGITLICRAWPDSYDLMG